MVLLTVVFMVMVIFMEDLCTIFSPVNAHVVRLLHSLLGIWSKVNDPIYTLFIGLMILHMIEWVTSGLINLHSFEKLDVVSHATLVSSNLLLMCLRLIFFIL